MLAHKTIGVKNMIQETHESIWWEEKCEHADLRLFL